MSNEKSHYKEFRNFACTDIALIPSNVLGAISSECIRYTDYKPQDVNVTRTHC